MPGVTQNLTVYGIVKYQIDTSLDVNIYGPLRFYLKRCNVFGRLFPTGPRETSEYGSIPGRGEEKYISSSALETYIA